MKKEQDISSKICPSKRKISKEHLLKIKKFINKKTNKNKIKTTNFNEILSKTLKNFTLLGYSWNLFNYLILPCCVFTDYKVTTGKMKTRGQEGKLIIKKADGKSNDFPSAQYYLKIYKLF